MTAREILSEGAAILSQCPGLATKQNVVNIRYAARLKWEQEEMGGLEHVQFAYRNGTPIVPLGDCCHPMELVKRGFVDGKGWPRQTSSKIHLFKWPDGNHWYASVEGKDVVEFGRGKWNTAQQAEDAAKRVFNL